MDKLIDYICDELEELEHKADKGKLSMAEMQYVDMLAHAKKNLLKADEMSSGESYMYDDGRMMPRYSNARGRGRNARRDSRGRYSSESRYAMDTGHMINELHDMMEDAPDEKTRMEFQKFIDKMERM